MIIDSYMTNHSVIEIASILNLKYKTVYSIIQVYKKENRIEQKLKGGPRRKALTEDHVDAIKSWIDENCGITLQHIQGLLRSKFNVAVCLKTIDRYIGCFNYTLKSATLIPERRNDEKSLNERYDYANKFMDILSNLDENNLFFVDEVGFNVSIRSKRGRSLAGSPAVHNVKCLRSRNISVCCAMNKGGIVKYVTQTSAFNTATFANFIDEILQYIKDEHICRSVVIMDNVRFHKHQSIKDKFLAMHVDANICELMFLPPYSPFLNPIENMFSKWKGMIRESRPKSEAELFAYIDKFSEYITAEDCSGYFRNVFSFLPKCLSRTPIYDGN
mgnify:FL=1